MESTSTPPTGTPLPLPPQPQPLPPRPRKSRFLRDGLKAALVAAGLLIVAYFALALAADFAVSRIPDAWEGEWLSRLGDVLSMDVEADDYGLRLVHRVYGDTEGCLEFFEKISSPTAAWREA